MGQKKGLGHRFPLVLVPGLGADSACSNGAPWGRPALGPARAGHKAEGCDQAAVSLRLLACGLQPCWWVSPWPLPLGPPASADGLGGLFSQAAESNLHWWALRGFDLPTCPQEAVFFRRSFCLSSSPREQTPLVSLLPSARMLSLLSCWPFIDSS